MENDNRIAQPAPEPEKKGLMDRAYEFFIDGGPAKVSIVERIDEPMTVWESTQHTVVSAAKGAAISAFLSGIVGAVIGAISGASTGADAVAGTLDAEGSVTLGGDTIPGIGSGPAITLADSDSLRSALDAYPTTTSAALGAADSALNIGTKAALVGAGVGAIKGGWADRITRERELVAARPLEKGA